MAQSAKGQKAKHLNPENKRFQELRIKLELNQDELANKLEMNQGTISGIENGKSGVSKKVLKKMGEVFGIRPEYILNGEQPIYDDSLKSNNKTNASLYLVNPERQNMIIVPIKAFGGFLSGYANKAYVDTLEKTAFPFVRGECFAFEVEGMSMYKTVVVDKEIFETGYAPGSHVICTPIENFTWMTKDKDYVLVTVDGIILKRYVKIDDNKCHLKSINEEYNPVNPIPLNKIKKVFYVERSVQTINT